MPETKRTISQVANDGFGHDDKKQNTSKPGRKPVDTEPKSRRTAQNRAAQRAYRERKERKMKDLEDKVASLEDDKMKALSELDFLKAQVDLLKRELSRVTGQTSFSSVPSGTPALEKNTLKVENEASWPSIPSLEFNGLLSSAQQLPDLVSGSSSSTSPLNDNLNTTPSTSTFDSSSAFDSVSSNLNLAPSFEEQTPFCSKLSEACGGLLEAEPKVRRKVAPYVESAADILFPLPNYESPFHSLFSPNENISDPFFTDGNPTSNLTLPSPDNDPLAFLNDAGFDVSLALGNNIDDVVEKGAPESDTDKLSGLVTEESLFDPLANPAADFDPNEFINDAASTVRSSRSASESGGRYTASSMSSYNDSPTIFEEDSDIIPAGEKTMKCSEIWDRITAHPRYTEIDIDGLCKELQTKAKCSEQGVVINVNDVKNIIDRSAPEKA